MLIRLAIMASGAELGFIQFFQIWVFTARRSYTSAVLGAVILSVRDKTNQCTADILMPHERAITLHCVPKK